MMKSTFLMLPLVLGVITAWLVASAAQPPFSSERRIGFTAASLREQQKNESRFMAMVSAGAISDVHRTLTRRPHRAGSDGAREVAEYLRDTLRQAGLDVEVTEYLAYLSEPRAIAIDIVSPAAISLSTIEPSDPRDPTSSHAELDPGFIAYSASGDVTATVVHAGYGLPEDYQQLKVAGTEVKGRIALVRYGRSHRAVKVYSAEQAGAAAVLLYSDPRDDGVARGAAWPEGMWRAPHFIQRGNAKYSWFWHGDPLTPGVAATRDSAVLDASAVPTLPKIPVAVVSAEEARKVIDRLNSDVTMRLRIEMRNERKPIRNVIARLRGSLEPRRWIILGTHHDAWTFGGIDPGSSAAVIVEVAKQLGALNRAGWRPARGIMFAFWDAEEYGLIGSTEFAEHHARDLQDTAVVYINSDMYTPGRLVAGGVPSLRDFVAEVTRDVTARDAPASGAPSAVSSSRAVNDPIELSALGSGADFVAFQDHLGIPTLALEYLFEGGYGFGAYHSSYDSRYYMEHVSDPGFVQGVALARLLGVGVMRLASAPILPFRVSHYANRIAAFLQEAQSWPGKLGVSAKVDTRRLQTTASDIASQAREVEALIDRHLATGQVPQQASAVNDALARIERALLDQSEPADQRWYRHVIYGWNIYSMYDGQPLPGLYEAVRTNNALAIARERARIQAALERMRLAVGRTRGLLAP